MGAPATSLITLEPAPQLIAADPDCPGSDDLRCFKILAVAQVVRCLLSNPQKFLHLRNGDYGVKVFPFAWFSHVIFTPCCCDPSLQGVLPGLYL